ncbi:L-fucose:H+ symporter permease [Mucilaginibacter terrae]|uniref:L-fucose:H+ symporter permease n=1 Tax=Mucilaginibacter terrae TaxID=1955052 RepID=UPI00364576FA
MQLQPSIAVKPAFTEKKFLVTLIFVISLFLFWGIAISMADVLNKHFQQVLNLSKSQSGLVQFSIFGAYFVMGIPAGLFMKRFGYKNGVLLGLLLFALGSFLFVPAAAAQSFLFFRVALFIMGCGLSTLETVAHPFAAALGNQQTSDQRINFAQAFNAVGSTIGPTIGSFFIFNTVAVHGEAGLSSIKTLYIIIGIAITVVAIAFAFVKVPPVADPHQAITEGYHTDAVLMPVKKGLFGHRHFVWAVTAQFFNVAAQSGTWAFFINYGHEKMGLTDATAARYMSIFMFMMLLGRFVGTYLMRFIAPNRLLAAFALGNIVMCLIVAQGFGWVSFIALFMVNFFFSIMFPTIFSLGIKNLGVKTQQASSFISMGVVGGAFFPLIMGQIANYDVAAAYYLPIVCYAVIFLFGYKFYKS